MFDIWAFLLQTLTVSGVAVLLLAVKELFQDKLPPRWHFLIWGILGLSLVIPAGLGGRYVLFNWPLVVETVKSLLTGDYGYTRILFPFPAPPRSLPRTAAELVYGVYFLGVIGCLCRYLLSYVRLRLILRRGWAVDAELAQRVKRIADFHHIRLCRTVSVPGLPSAFVCGVFRPLLALPADVEIDDKILLHELLHLKSRDTIWSIVICVFRAIHWCNPLLRYCASRAGNDLEARCDQRVLELLEGEDRRDYGRILLSMANDRFARTPGATCANNGGKNIRRRIEAIARFKLYPTGMRLVSVCALIILAVPMVMGVRATAVYEVDNRTLPPQAAFASARVARCTTPAGAFDAYGKAILEQNGVYRAMCAPADMQAALAASVIERYENGRFPYWDIGIGSWPNTETGYYIYNLRQVSDTAYEGLFVIQLNYRPDNRPEEQFGNIVIAYQDLRVEQEDDRWVAIPLEDFQWMEDIRQQIGWGVHSLPGWVYSGTACGVQVDVKVQTVYGIDNTVTEETAHSFLFGTTTHFDSTPKPDAQFDWERYMHVAACTHLGTQAERDAITQIGVSFAPMAEGDPMPHLPAAHGDGGGGSSEGKSWQGSTPEPGWGPTIEMGGGGISGDADPTDCDLPDAYGAYLYINKEKAAELILTLQEGGPQ